MSEPSFCQINHHVGQPSCRSIILSLNYPVDQSRCQSLILPPNHPIDESSSRSTTPLRIPLLTSPLCVSRSRPDSLADASLQRITDVTQQNTQLHRSMGSGPSLPVIPRILHHKYHMLDLPETKVSYAQTRADECSSTSNISNVSTHTPSTYLSSKPVGKPSRPYRIVRRAI